MLKVEIDPCYASVKQAYPQAAHIPWKTVRFRAYVHNDYGNKGVTWEIAQGAGHIDEQGVFTPPVETGRSIVLARSVLDPAVVATAPVDYDKGFKLDSER